MARGRATTRGDRVLLSRFYRKPDDVIAVTVTPSAVANQLAECPPHHWAIDAASEGVCRKCGAHKQFPTAAWGTGEHAPGSGALAPTRRDPTPNKVTSPDATAGDETS